MDPSQAQKTIEEMVRRIVERFHPEKIILFGSYARGTADFDSDVDLLVVLRNVKSKYERCVEIHRALAGVGLAKDIIVTTPEEIEQYRDTRGTIIWPALQEGKVVYERTA